MASRSAGAERNFNPSGGTPWQFSSAAISSAAKRDAFAKNPEKYAPQYGGYCSWAGAHNYTADGAPQAWKSSMANSI